MDIIKFLVMKKIFLVFCLISVINSFSQNNFYSNPKYIEARTAFEKSDYTKFKKIVKKQLSKSKSPNIFIDLANKIITDIDPAFENELDPLQKEIAIFSRKINELHNQERFYDVYLAYKNCSFLNKLSPYSFYILTSSIELISYKDYKKLLDLNLKANGDHYRAAWSISYLSINNLGKAYDLWTEIESNSKYDAYPGVKNFATHLKKYNPEIGLSEWRSNTKVYATKDFLKRYPNDAMAYRKLGHLLKSLHKYEAAKNAFIKSNEIDPFYADGNSLRDAIICMHLLEQDKEAEIFTKKLVKTQFPNKNQELKYLEVSSELQSSAGNKTKARENLALILEKNPKNETAIILLSEIENSANRKKEVLKLYRKLSKKTLIKNLNIYNKYIQALRNLEMYDEYIEEWQTFIEEDRIGNESTYNKFYSYFSSIEENDTALEMIDKGIEFFPLSAWSLRNRTEKKIDQKNYTSAEVDLRKSIEIDPNNSWSKLKFKTIINLTKKNLKSETLALYNLYPYSYNWLNALKNLEDKKNQISFLKNFKAKDNYLIKDRNVYIATSNLDKAPYMESKLSKVTTQLDSLFYYRCIFYGKYNYYRERMSKKELNDLLTLSDKYLELGGDKLTYHKHRAYIFRSLNDKNQVKIEANNAIKVDPNNNDFMETSIVHLGNYNAFIPLRKSVNKNLYDYTDIRRYVWISNLYGGSNINAIWAYEKCKEIFPDNDCSKTNYIKALDALGDPYKNMKSYKGDTHIGTTKRYINWYNNTREKSLKAKKEIIYDQKDNKLTTIDENGEISIKIDDPFSGKPVLKQKGSVWIKYGYTSNGSITKIETSAKQIVELLYDENNKITTMIDGNHKTGKFREFVFDYNKKGKPIKISLKDIGSIDITYDSIGEIKKVESKEGPKMALQVTQGFQNLLSLTKNFNLDDIPVKDLKYEQLKETYDDAAYDLNYNETALNSDVIKKYTDYVSYLKNNLSDNANYASEALDISSEILTYLNSDISNDLKLQLLNFSDYFYDILRNIRRLGVANNYWNNWNQILEILEKEKQNQKSLNTYRKKIETLQTKFKSAPIQLLSSAEWLPKASLSNDAYWTSSNLQEIYKDYDFTNTPANHILKIKNGDILIAFNKGIAVKRNGFWKFLYYDTLNKKLIQDPELIKIRSKTTFNYFAETENGNVIVNTSSGTFLVQENYKTLLKIKISDDNYIGNSSCKMVTFDNNLVLYNNNSINIIEEKDGVFNFIQQVEFKDKTIQKVKYFYNNDNNIELFVQTNKSIETLKINTDTKTSDSFKFIDTQNIIDFAFEYSSEDDEYYLYFLKNNTLFKKNITEEVDRKNTDAKPLEIIGNIVLNKQILGLCKVPVNRFDSTLGVITDMGINFYKDNHFEFFKIDSKDGLDEFTNHYYANNDSEFGILTKQKILHFSLEDYFYSQNKPSKIKLLKNKKITLMLQGRNLYFSNNDEIFESSIETDGFGTSISDFDVASNEDVFLSDYKTVNKVVFNQNEDDTYQIEKLFEVDPFTPEKFWKQNNKINKVKIAKDGTVWATTNLSVFRYNKKMTPALKEFNFFKNEKEFPAKSHEVFNLIETFDGKIMVVNSSEGWIDYKGIELNGGLVIYNKSKDAFEFLEDDKNKPNFPWFITSYTETGKNEAILGTTSGFAYHSKGGIKSYRRAENKSYLDIEKKYKNLFLGTEGVEFGEFLLFGCGEGVIAFKDNQWFYPERLNQLLPKFSEHGKWGGNKVNAIAVDHLQRLNIATDLGLLIINANKIDPYDLMLMNRDVNKTIEYYNIDKLQKERDHLISNLPDNSESKKVVEEVTVLKDKIYDLQKSKVSFAKDFKLKETGFKTINIDSVDTEINRITKKYSELLLTLKEKNPVIYQTLKIPPLEIATLRNMLKEDECIVQYIPLTNKLIIQLITKNKLILKEVVCLLYTSPSPRD